MDSGQLSSSFIIRIVRDEAGQRIVVHNLRSQEVREFSSWHSMLSYLRETGPSKSLR